MRVRIPFCSPFCVTFKGILGPFASLFTFLDSSSVMSGEIGGAKGLVLPSAAAAALKRAEEGSQEHTFVNKTYDD